jgi:hypothetical protein
MLQFHVELCCGGNNVAHKVRRYIHFFVASELVSDVLGFYPCENSCNKYEQQARRCPAEALYDERIRGVVLTPFLVLREVIYDVC